MAKRQQGKDNINHFIQQQGLKKYMVDRPTLKKEPSICVCDEEATTTFSDETEMTVFLLYPNPGKKKKNPNHFTTIPTTDMDCGYTGPGNCITPCG